MRVKVYGTMICPGCKQILDLLKRKKIASTFYDISTSEGLAELASDGLADELSVPILVDAETSEKLELEEYQSIFEALPDM